MKELIQRYQLASVLLLTEAVMTELPEKEAPATSQPRPDLY